MGKIWHNSILKIGFGKISSFSEQAVIYEGIRSNNFYDKWKNKFLVNFGIALSNVINIIDPDIVVLGGGLSNIDFLYDKGISLIQKNIFSNKKDTPILPNKLGDSAGVFGAALLN